MNLIRNWAVVLYFQPFSSIKLDRMSAAFGWSVEEVEQHVVALIQSGDIKGRVDSQNKVQFHPFHQSRPLIASFQILQAKKTDYRADLFARAIRAGTEMQNSNRKLLLRMRLCVAFVAINSQSSFAHQLILIDPVNKLI
jgi:COP9 signalosome complex subunit 1